MTHGIDTPAALIVQKILDGGFTELTTEGRSDFTRFVMSLRARHPDAVALALNESKRQLTTALARDPEEYLAAKEPGSPSTLIEWTEQYTPELYRNFGVSIIPGVITDNKTGERIFRMPWWVHDIRGAGTDLLISDRPCLLEGDAIEGSCLIRRGRRNLCRREGREPERLKYPTQGPGAVAGRTRRPGPQLSRAERDRADLEADHRRARQQGQLPDDRRKPGLLEHRARVRRPRHRQPLGARVHPRARSGTPTPSRTSSRSSSAGIYGCYFHVSETHLHRYAAEFDFRYNNRIALGIDDVARADRALVGAKGKRLTYRNNCVSLTHARDPW